MKLHMGNSMRKLHEPPTAYGYIWLHMGVYGCIRGCMWLHVAACGCTGPRVPSLGALIRDLHSLGLDSKFGAGT